MTIDDLARAVAMRVEHEQLARDLMLVTKDLIRDLYHDGGLTAKRIEDDTVRLLTSPPYNLTEAQTRGMGLSENAIRKVVGRRAT